MSFKSKSIDLSVSDGASSSRSLGFLEALSSTSISESRKRSSKRDNAIRRKIESDLNKRRKNSASTSRPKRGAPGTALALKPSAPLICKPSMSVFEVSQIMTAKRGDCILVVNDENDLVGIFTAKDLAFRIVGSNLNANSVTVDQIMTPNPIVTNANDSASNALNLMVTKGFRHLPVVDDDNEIVGVLDITKCYAQQMEKMEKMHESSKSLYEALDNVHSQIGITEQPLHIYQYFEQLRAKMSGPVLLSVLNDIEPNSQPIYCSIKTTVYDATVLMKENRTTAVLIKDNDEKVAGIFTSKDVVLRVIAAGLTPKNCSIVRVMTPQPDFADENISIQEALRKMFDGHYLNLPVTRSDGEIVGIVDVLKLTYATLNQIKNISEQESDAEGPAWNKFWTSLDNDSDSVLSGSMTSVTRPETPTNLSRSALPFDEQLHPLDSVSHITTPQKLYPAESINDVPFVFKVRFPSIENRVYRISVKPADGVKKLKTLVDEKLYPKDMEAMNLVGDDGTIITTYAISYIDDEGDIVSIMSDDDLLDCVKLHVEMSKTKVDLYLHNPHDEVPIPGHRRHRSSAKGKKKPNLLGDIIPYEVLIPGAVLVLATSAIIGFSFSRR